VLADGIHLQNFRNIIWLALNGSGCLPSLGFVELHFVNLSDSSNHFVDFVIEASCTLTPDRKVNPLENIPSQH
jgi:hypothetical protein